MMNNGKVKTAVVANTQGESLKPMIRQMIEKGAIVVSDEWGAYNGLSDYQHKVVKHNEDEYVNVEGFHTNSIEGFWSLLKRGIFGIYHSASRKHLSKYCDEFAFRYNTRRMNDGERFELSLSMSKKKRITYKEVIEKGNVVSYAIFSYENL